LPIKNRSVSGIPQKKAQADPFMGFKKILQQTVLGLADKKTDELGAYA
jgi:hypothetical protein